MPRNQNGSYFLPEPAVKPGETIRSEWANNTTGDIGKALTDSLDRAGLGGMTGSLKLTDGTQNNPALTFTNEPNIGIIRVRKGVMGLVFAGEVMCEISDNGTTYLRDGRVFLTGDPTIETEAATKRYVDAKALGTLTSIPDGTVAAPGLAFGTEKDSGFYRAGSRDLGLSIAGKRLVRYQADVMTVDGRVNATSFAGDGSQLTNLPAPIPSFPAGTVMLFAQTAAPTGWTKLSTHNNKSLRVVSGTAGSGGSVSFTTAFSARNVDATVLTQAQMPAHGHSFTASTASAGSHTHTGSSSDSGGHKHVVPHTYGDNYSESGIAWAAATGTTTDKAGRGNTSTHANKYSSEAGVHRHTMNLDAAGAHTHTLTGNSNNTGGTQAHNHSLNLAVQYVDVIMARKD